MKKPLLIFFGCLASTIFAFGQFTLIGSQLDGNAPNDNFGWSVALDATGETLAVGAPLYDDDFGQVRVYQKSGNSWVQLGGDINGYEIGQQYGFSLALSANGRRLALGGIGGSPGSRGGHVRIYDFVNGQWVFGDSLLAEAVGDQFGFSLDMNGAGDRLVVGGRNNGGNGTKSGHVRVFEFKGNNWSQMGMDIDGEAAGDEFGFTVSMSGSGDIIAVGSTKNSGAVTNAGHVRVFEWKNSSWVQKGSDIDGQNASEAFGFSVSLSDNGKILATTAPLHDHGAGFGSTRVYEFSSNSWIQLGSDLRGTSSTEGYGEAVSISGDGQRLAIGTKSNDDNALSSGRVDLFEWNAGAWTDLMSPIKGTATFDNLGKSVALNQFGTAVAIGANLANGTQGFVVVYEDPDQPVGIKDEITSEFSVLSIPQHFVIQLESGNEYEPVEVKVYALTGQLLVSRTFSSGNEMNISHNLAAGMYIVKVKQGKGILSKKVVVY